MKRNNPNELELNTNIKKPKYYSWKMDIVSCDKCKWSGYGLNAKIGGVMDSTFFLNCPNCGKEFIEFILFPTIAEAKDHGSLKEKMEINKIEAFWENYEKEKLKNADEISNVKSNQFILEWDLNKEHTQLIRYKNKIIWREPAIYESYQRFIEIGTILKQKFGTRLQDFIPTDRSKPYLYGDKAIAIILVEEFRKKLQK